MRTSLSSALFVCIGLLPLTARETGPMSGANGLLGRGPQYQAADRDGGATVSALESNPLEADRDYDGRTDAQEQAEGTDAANAASFAQVRLGRWRFDTGQFLCEGGQAPLVNANVKNAASFDGRCAQFSTAGAILKYRDVEVGGHANINFRCGTIRFFFKPEWTSAATPGGPGGPGSEAVLIQAGSRDQPGYWALRITADGREARFAQYGSGSQVTTVALPISLLADQWYFVSLGYSGEAALGSGLSITRRLHSAQPAGYEGAVGPPVQFVPSAAVRAQGFCVGNALDGASPARGSIDELETYNAPIPNVMSVADTSSGVYATVRSSPPTIALHWRNWPSWPMRIKRRVAGETIWSDLAGGSNCRAWSFTDSTVALGTRYEYLVWAEDTNYPVTSYTDRYLECAIEAPPVHARGWILLLIDQTLGSALTNSAEFLQLKEDLVGDGWRVLQQHAPRHDDLVWANNTQHIATVKRRVDTVWATNSQLQAIYVLGHVTAPYSGSQRPDMHYTRPFPVDMYYGDTVRGPNDWTDSTTHRPLADPRPPFVAGVPNDPGDGKFDQALYPSTIEVPTMRVDFARMDAFLPLTEVDLLRRYLDKAHRFRHGLLTFGPDCSVFNRVRGLPGEESAFQYLVGRRAVQFLRAWHGDSTWKLQHRELFRESPTASFLLTAQAGFGASYGIDMGGPDQWTTSDVAASGGERSAGLFLLAGSLLGDWNKTPTNFFKALLAQPNSGLSAIWGLGAGLHDVALQPLGAGRTLGETFARVLYPVEARDDTLKSGAISGGSGGNVHLSPLGDPSLHLLVAAPSGPVTFQSQGPAVTLTWARSPNADALYYVYRSTAGVEGEFTLLTQSPVAVTSFVDQPAPGGPKTYMVRAAELRTTGCGTFWVLGQGRFVAAN